MGHEVRPAPPLWYTFLTSRRCIKPNSGLPADTPTPSTTIRERIGADSLVLLVDRALTKQCPPIMVNYASRDVAALTDNSTIPVRV